MLYTVTYKTQKKHEISTEILNRTSLNDSLKHFEKQSYYSLVSILPTTAEDIAGRIVDFIKDIAPYDYADTMEVGDTDVDMIAEYSANLLEDKDKFLKDITVFFEEIETLDNSVQDFRESISKMIKEF